MGRGCALLRAALVLLLLALGPSPARGDSKDDEYTKEFKKQRVCRDWGIGLWVVQSNGNADRSEFNYRDGSGFTLEYEGEQIADLDKVTGSGNDAWPVLRKDRRSPCGCCELCRAQLNANSYLTSKAWSFRKEDGACRLWTADPYQGKALAIQSGTAEERAWQSGTVDKVKGKDAALFWESAMVGDPHWMGFNHTDGAAWGNFPGRPGGSYLLYRDGKGARLAVTFGAGGKDGKGTFIRSLVFTRGLAKVTADLREIGTQWRLLVAAGGRAMGPNTLVRMGGAQDIVVQATPVRDGRPSGIIITVGNYLRIRAAQRWPVRAGQLAAANWGNWLDVYLTVLAPLPAPVTGMMGSTYQRKPAAAGGSAASAAGGALPTAALVFEQP
ncbi:hypothetical protein C2E20_2516 [Micractinium conductrix]|uniref:Uncharacterized protein n=1 Tax=Micractinium conductrix TaxID=554055 RepID=A0A2P6VJI1_9CHLO|nr:hypothetical protein C2E20_2516 [Micractinium conductrix]|eukprot:PSC74261.1 hypothetical protein C2E20_2516 [Micractinium conductrix]